MINIKGLEKAKVLKALYDASHVQGMGFLQARDSFTLEDAQKLIDENQSLYFDYVYGRVLKVDLSKDEFDEYLFDRDNYNGAAKDAIDALTNQEPKIVEPLKYNYNEYDSSDNGYDELLKIVADKFNYITGNKDITLFRVSTKNLYDKFLSNLPEESRQHYNCNTCRSFVNKYGTLVYIDDNYERRSAIWDYDKTPEFFKPAVKAMIKEVENKSYITSAYYTSYEVLGTPVTGEWKHIHVCFNEKCDCKSKESYYTKTKDISDKINASIQNFKMVHDALDEYDLNTAKQALILLKTNQLCRAEKFTKMAKAVLELFETLEDEKNIQRRNNIIWKYCSDNANYCHIKSGILGTLYDDIKDGYDFDTIAKRFADKADPMHYMRPKAAPTRGNIERAEELIHELGLEKSLERRFANIDELYYGWKPEEVEKEVDVNESGSIFGHLLAKDEIEKSKRRSEIHTGTRTVSWAKFTRDVLPDVKSMQIKIPMSSNGFVCYTTALHEDAKPILKYDKEDNRNPIARYTYNGSTFSKDWNLDNNTFYDVYGISTRPECFGKPLSEFEDVVFIIEGMKDLRKKNIKGNALFPEILIPKLHEVRATIEAYSNDAQLYGFDEYSACGMALTRDVVLKVNMGDGVTSTYIIDRYE